MTIPPEEAKSTILARGKIKAMFYDRNYNIEEEVRFPDVTNNMGERLDPCYQTDFILTKTFILELDPQTDKPGKAKGHGTKKRRTHDKWRDQNFRHQLNLKTVRLNPKDVIDGTEQDILAEINHQLKVKE